jgi:hypothetical protein
LLLAQLVQRARRRIRRLEPARNRAVDADLYAGLLEKSLAEGIRHGRPRERLLEVHGMIRRHGVELRERREARRAGRRHELIRVEPADRRDPFAARQRGSAGPEKREDVGDRGRRFEPRIVAGPKAEQHDVVVIVDEPGNDRPPVEVDRARAT